MAIIRFNPNRNLFAWPRWFDEFEEDFSVPTAQRGLRIHETDKNIVVEAVVAGVSADDVEVNVEDGVLTIKAESKSKEETKTEYKTSTYQYYYTTALSGGEWHKADAEVKNGVISVTIPKAESAKPRKITVKAMGK